MFSPIPLTLLISSSLSLFLSTSPSSALPTSIAPKCAILCFEKKLEEANYLAPQVADDDLKGLCGTSEFVAAYNNCLQDNCKEKYLEAAYLFGVKVCRGELTQTAIHGTGTTTTSTRKLASKPCEGDQCLTSSSPSSSPSSSALTQSHDEKTCTCTESIHHEAASQVIVAAASAPTDSTTTTTMTDTANPTMTTSTAVEETSATSIASSIEPSQTSTSGASRSTVIGIFGTIFAFFVAACLV